MIPRPYSTLSPKAVAGVVVGDGPEGRSRGTVVGSGRGGCGEDGRCGESEPEEHGDPEDPGRDDESEVQDLVPEALRVQGARVVRVVTQVTPVDHCLL